MAHDVIQSSELSRLSSLGVCAYDEAALASSVLEASRTQRECGISTSAPLEVVEELLERVRGEAAMANKSGGWESRDHANLRLQLLERLMKQRRARTVALSIGSESPPLLVESLFRNPVGVDGVGTKPEPTDKIASSESRMQLEVPDEPPVTFVVPRGMRVNFEELQDAPPPSSYKDTEMLCTDMDDALSSEEDSPVVLGSELSVQSDIPQPSPTSLKIPKVMVKHEKKSKESQPSSSGGNRQHSDADFSSYVARVDDFKVILKKLCKKLRKCARDTIGKQLEDVPLSERDQQIKDAVNESFPKDSVNSPLGPGSPSTLPNGVSVPFFIASQLLPYQLEGVEWLTGLFFKRQGGILGDEMGMGKTVQIAALLGTLAANGLLRPSLIICPATLIAHWQRELTVWWPPLRVVALHGALGGGSGLGGSSKETISSFIRDAGKSKGRIGGEHPPDIFILTYEGLRSHATAISGSSTRWGHVILDEGHKIRNPEAAVSTLAKAIPSPHRIILSGSPIQNRLKELWSLMDFAVPGRLGTLPVFEAQFAAPIAAGGWAHSTPLQLQAAYHCAQTLRDLLAPNLLRRLKIDVNRQLPLKTERLIFCRLEPLQREAYQSFLQSPEVRRVLMGESSAFRALTIVRKIANHPWLLDGGDGESWDSGIAALRRGQGDPLAHSSKLKVLAVTLEILKSDKRRCLVFTQGTAMLDIIEDFVKSRGYTYLRMDGGTPVASRQSLVDRFNEDPSKFIFLLTTRVGGVGVNLIGADRVIMYDADWNPATDKQAKERAWRLGQRRHVVIYRLVTKGTVEEKILKRTIFKDALSWRVLVDAKGGKDRPEFQRLRDLFSLDDNEPDCGIQSGTNLLQNEPPKEKKMRGSRGSKRAGSALLKEKQPSESSNDALDSGSDNGEDLSDTEAMRRANKEVHLLQDLSSYVQYTEPFFDDATDKKRKIELDELSRMDSDKNEGAGLMEGDEGEGGDEGINVELEGGEEKHTTILKAVIDSRSMEGSGAMAPPPIAVVKSLSGLSVNQRTLAIAYGERVAREALRSLGSRASLSNNPPPQTLTTASLEEVSPESGMDFFLSGESEAGSRRAQSLPLPPRESFVLASSAAQSINQAPFKFPHPRPIALQCIPPSNQTTIATRVAFSTLPGARWQVSNSLFIQPGTTFERAIEKETPCNPLLKSLPSKYIGSVSPVVVSDKVTAESALIPSSIVTAKIISPGKNFTLVKRPSWMPRASVKAEFRAAAAAASSLPESVAGNADALDPLCSSSILKLLYERGCLYDIDISAGIGREHEKVRRRPQISTGFRAGAPDSFGRTYSGLFHSGE